ncbi:MAG: helix-turn-helix domain-containing protein [Pseudonocardiaceae bacterium]
MALLVTEGEDGGVYDGVPGDWAESCLRILEAGAEGTDRVFALLVGATRRLTGADGALVVSWQATGPLPLAASGTSLQMPARRLTEGLTMQMDRSIASFSVQGKIDLVVWWMSGLVGPPSAERLEELRLFATLAAAACRQAGAPLSSLYSVARRLLASRDRHEVLQELATATADVLRAEIAGVFLATEDGESLEAKAVVGHRCIETARLRLAKGQSMVGHVYATGEVYRVDDWTTDPVISRELLSIATAEGTQACIGAPMQVDGAIVGVLAAWRRRRSLYTDDEVELIGTLADLAALGVQRALAEEKLRDLSQQLMAANEALSERYAEARHTLEIHQRLMRVVADGADLASVVDALRAITEQEVTFVGIEGTVVGAVGWLEALVLGIRGQDLPELGTEAVLLGPDAQGRHAISVTVRSAGQQWGTLAAAARLPVATRDVVATEQAAVACALLLSRQDAVAGAVRRLESEFVWDLLDGRIVDQADAIVRSRQLARELPVPARLVLLSVQASGDQRRRAATSPERIERFRTELTRRTAGLLGSYRTHAPLGWRGDTLALIVADRPLDAVRRIGHELCQLGQDMGRELCAGVSGPVHTIGQYLVAGRQAAYARAATRPPEAPVAVFEDLGAVQFLLEPAHGEDLDRYADQQLGVLIAYDRDHDTDLVNTLNAYLRSDGHVQRAAQELCIHPKTMSYRLGRIEALTGMAVGRQEDRFNAQLALKILAMRTDHARPE